MNDIDVLNLHFKKSIVSGILSILLLIILLVYGENLYNYCIEYAETRTVGTAGKIYAMIYITPILTGFIFIPKAFSFIKLIMDMLCKKQKTIKVTGIKKPKVPWNMREDYVIFYAKSSSKPLYRFIVFKDIYSLKGKKTDNTYEVTYFVFSKVVTNMKKCKKDTEYT